MRTRRLFRGAAPEATPDQPTGPLPVLDAHPTDPADALAEPDLPAAERALLVRELIWLCDRLTSPALVSHAERALAEVGVERPDLVGTPYDPSWQEAGSALPTADPALDGTVAEVEVAAWFDRDELVRPPVVAVYQADR